MTAPETARPVDPPFFRPRVLVGVVGVLFLVAVVQAVRSTGFVWDDDYTHLLISRAAFDDWRHLLDVWGRPLHTLTYMPAGLWGEGVARATSLVLLAVAGVAVCRAAPAGRNPRSVATLLLLAQPLTLRLGYSAMPQILFTAIFATVLALRASDRHAASSLVASALPLARVEGVVVLGVLALLGLRERRLHLIPLLSTGIVAWATATWIVHDDPLWLLHTNPWANHDYPTPGVTYILHALPIALGPVVPVLAAWGVARGRMDSAVRWSLLALSGFYMTIWTIPSLHSFGTPLYLVSLATPAALAASAGAEALSSVRLLERTTATVVGASVVMALLTMSPIPRDARVAGLAELTDVVRARDTTVLASSHPAFEWFARESRDVDAPGDDQVPTVVWDAKYGPTRWGSLAQLSAAGWQPDVVLGDGDHRVALLRCSRRGRSCAWPVQLVATGGASAARGPQR